MIVLDCNAAVSIALNTPEGQAIAALILDDEIIIAPDTLKLELTNVASKYARSQRLSRDEAREVAAIGIELVDAFVDADQLWKETFTESIRLDHCAYDIFYFVLARRNDATLFTLDKKLQCLCLENGVNCIALDTNF